MMSCSDEGSSLEEEEEDQGAEIVAVLSNARRSFSSGHSRPALVQFLRLIAIEPNLAPLIDEEVVAALEASVSALGNDPASGSILFNGTSRALPFSSHLAVAEGSFWHRASRHSEAMRCFERALDLDPSSAAAQEGLENLRSFAAERWHFRMLNDRARNAAYDTAIIRALHALREAGCHEPLVLDIGSGTGRSRDSGL